MRKLLIAFGLISASALYSVETRDHMNEWEKQNFIQTLQGEINKQQALVNSIKEKAARTDVVYPGAITTEFENAYIMLNVKRTLYENFVGTPSIESPVIQQKLLQIFQKDMITPGDLSDLDALVKQERPKYANPPASAAYPAANPAAAPSAAPAPSPTAVPAVNPDQVYPNQVR